MRDIIKIIGENIMEQKIYVKGNILIVGVGNSGTCIVNQMISSNIIGVEFVSIRMNKDQSLDDRRYLEIEEMLSKDYSIKIAWNRLQKIEEELKNVVKEHDMVIILGGMGGKYSTPLTSIIAKQAKRMSVFTMGIVSTPFGFENKSRMELALEGIEELRQEVDLLFTISNEHLLNSIEQKEEITVEKAYTYSNEKFIQTVQGIWDIVSEDANIALELEDLMRIAKVGKSTYIATKIIQKEENYSEVIQKMMQNLLLEKNMQNRILGIKVAILYYSGCVSFRNTRNGDKTLRELIGTGANVLIGMNKEEKASETRITIIAVGE